MLRNLTFHVCANSLKGLVAISCLVSGLQAAEEQVVLVYNRVQLAPRVLAKAEDRAAKIFHKVGIQVRWVDCLRAEATCSELAGSRSITLSIVKDPTKWFVNEALGYAALAPEGGNYAAVFMDRIEFLASVSQNLVTPADVLGHAIAHEIGHLLLSLVGHHPAGMMSARWTKTDLKRMGMSGLRFLPEEAATMRAEVSRRAAAGQRAAAPVRSLP